MYCDAHVEFIHHPDDEIGLDQKYLRRQITPGVINQIKPELLFLAVYVEPTLDAWAKQQIVINQYLKVIEENGWVLVRKQSDLVRPGIKVILHIEDLFGLGDDLSKLDLLFRVGIRSIGLTHNYRNQFAGGSLTDDGLSPLGRSVIKKMRKMGFILDFAHLSEAAFLEASTMNIFVPFISHAGLRSVFVNRRNISDRVLKVVKKQNGFIGLGLAGSFLAEKTATVNDYLDQILRAVELASVSNVGIGSDLGGVISFLPTNISGIDDLPKIEKQLPDPKIFGQNLLIFLKERSNLLL